jgi:hypothetical protein
MFKSDDMLKAGIDLWAGKQITTDRNSIKLTIEDRDAAVIPLVE